jgi:hypothetical protein
LELQYLRQIIGEHDMVAQKFQAYAQQAMDMQTRNFFEKSAQDAQNTKQQLMNFLK